MRIRDRIIEHGYQNILIYGSGIDTGNIINDIIDTTATITIVDDDPQKVGTSCFSFPVYPPSILEEQRFDLYIIGSYLYAESIRKKLEARAIDQPKIIDPFLNIKLALRTTAFRGDCFGRIYSSNRRMRFELEPNSFKLAPDGSTIYSVNSSGLYGKEFKREKPDYIQKRIICCGDSNLYNNWPWMMEELLNKGRTNAFHEVINAAIPGYTSLQTYERLSHCLQYKPDIILVSVGWNDFFPGNDPLKYLKKIVALARKNHLPCLLSTLASPVAYRGCSISAIPEFRLPVWTNDSELFREKLCKINQQIRAMTKKSEVFVCKLDEFLEPLVQTDPQRYFKDMIHLREEWYPLIAGWFTEAILSYI